jgi:hypothetical protein
MTVEFREFIDSVIVPVLVERILREQQGTAHTSSCGTDGGYQKAGYQKLEPNGSALDIGKHGAAA